MSDYKMFSELKAEERLSFWPDSKILNEAAAAVFTGLSLVDFRSCVTDGTGPKFTKEKISSRLTLNQFRKKDLLAWVSSNRFDTDEDEADYLKIPLTILQINKSEAFWMIHETIYYPVCRTDPMSIPILLEDHNIQWIPIIEAATQRKWYGNLQYREFLERALPMLEYAMTYTRERAEKEGYIHAR